MLVTRKLVGLGGAEGSGERKRRVTEFSAEHVQTFKG